MDKFKAPNTFEEFVERSKEANLRSIQTVIAALERQRANLTRSIDAEIKFHNDMAKYLEDGTKPEGLN